MSFHPAPSPPHPSYRPLTVDLNHDGRVTPSELALVGVGALVVLAASFSIGSVLVHLVVNACGG